MFLMCVGVHVCVLYVCVLYVCARDKEKKNNIKLVLICIKM